MSEALQPHMAVTAKIEGGVFVTFYHLDDGTICTILLCMERGRRMYLDEPTPIPPEIRQELMSARSRREVVRRAKRLGFMNV